MSKEKILKMYENPLNDIWDNKSITYDTNLYNWYDRFLSVAQELKPDITDLQKIHEHFQLEELIGLRLHFEKYTRGEEFSSLIDQWVEEYVSDKIEEDDYFIQQTAGVRVVIPNQGKLGRLLPFHSGFWTGYDNHTHTCWFPLTKAWDSNTMQVMSWENSIDIVKTIYDNQLSYEEMERLCCENSWPVNLDYGQVWLFNQGHLHGNINNETGVSRVSFDIRVISTKSEFEFRKPGSYYRLPGDSSEKAFQKLDTTGKWLIFTDPCSNFTYPTPHYMVREFMFQYANRIGIKPTDWTNEYYMIDWFPTFKYRLTQDYSGIMLPSIFSLNSTIEESIEMIQLGLDQGIQLLFCDENIVVTDEQDLYKVERLLRLKEKQ